MKHLAFITALIIVSIALSCVALKFSCKLVRIVSAKRLVLFHIEIIAMLYFPKCGDASFGYSFASNTEGLDVSIRKPMIKITTYLTSYMVSSDIARFNIQITGTGLLSYIRSVNEVSLLLTSMYSAHIVLISSSEF